MPRITNAGASAITSRCSSNRWRRKGKRSRASPRWSRPCSSPNCATCSSPPATISTSSSFRFASRSAAVRHIVAPNGQEMTVKPGDMFIADARGPRPLGDHHRTVRCRPHRTRDDRRPLLHLRATRRRSRPGRRPSRRDRAQRPVDLAYGADRCPGDRDGIVRACLFGAVGHDRHQGGGRPTRVDNLSARLQNAVRLIGQAKSGGSDGGTARPPKTKEDR